MNTRKFESPPGRSFRDRCKTQPGRTIGERCVAPSAAEVTQVLSRPAPPASGASNRSTVHRLGSNPMAGTTSQTVDAAYAVFQIGAYGFSGSRTRNMAAKLPGCTRADLPVHAVWTSVTVKSVRRRSQASSWVRMPSSSTRPR